MQAYLKFNWPGWRLNEYQMNKNIFESCLIHLWEPWCISRKTHVEFIVLYFQLMWNWKYTYWRTYAIAQFKLKTYSRLNKFVWDFFEKYKSLNSRLKWNWRVVKTKSLKLEKKDQCSNYAKKRQFIWNVFLNLPTFLANGLDQFLIVDPDICLEYFLKSIILKGSNNAWRCEDFETCLSHSHLQWIRVKFQFRGHWCWGYRGHDTVWLAGCNGFSPCSKSNFSDETQELLQSKYWNSIEFKKVSTWFFSSLFFSFIFKQRFQQFICQ